MSAIISSDVEKKAWYNRPYFWVLIVIIGALLRLIGLGSSPLGENEARLAYQVIDLQSVSGSSSPLYISFTSIFFWLFGPNNFLARFFPALMGISLILLPFFLDQERKNGLALWIALWLAIDPALVAVSRQVNTQIILLTTLFYAFVFLWKKDYFKGLLFGCLSVFSSPLIFHFLVPVLLTGWLATVFWKVNLPDIHIKRLEKRHFWLAVVLALLFMTCFMVIPQNIGVWANFLPHYLETWRSSTGMHFMQFLFGMLGYELGLVFFAVLGAVYFLKNNQTIKIITLWITLWLVWILIFPGKEVFDLIFIIPPLAYLAGLQIQNMVKQSGEGAKGSLLLGVVLLGILAYLTQIIFRMGGIGDNENLLLKILPIAIPIIMAMILTLLVSWERSLSTALHGIYWALGTFLVILSVFSLFRITSPQSDQEIWKMPGRIQEEKAIFSFIQNVDEWRKSHTKPLTIVAPSERYVWRWAFRDRLNVSYISGEYDGFNPDVVIAFNTLGFNESNAYRGRAFLVDQRIAWELLSPPEWFDWMFSRSLPEAVIQKQEAILWVRNDILPEGLVGNESLNLNSELDNPAN